MTISSCTTGSSATTPRGSRARTSASKRAVVVVDVLGPAHQRRPPGPVDAGRARPTPTAASARANVDRRARPARRARRRAARRANATATRSASDRIAVRDEASGTARHRGLARCSATPCARTRSWSSRYLRIVPSVTPTARSSRCASPERGERAAPSRSSRRHPAACRARGRAAPRPRPRPGGPAASRHLRRLQRARSRARARSRDARSSGRGSGASARRARRGCGST